MPNASDCVPPVDPAFAASHCIFDKRLLFSTIDWCALLGIHDVSQQQQQQQQQQQHELQQHARQPTSQPVRISVYMLDLGEGFGERESLYSLIPGQLYL